MITNKQTHSRILSVALVISMLVMAGCAGPAQRNKWQKNIDFSKRRNVYYNEFVSSGGMAKDDTNDGHTSAWRSEIQQAITQGRTNLKQ